MTSGLTLDRSWFNDFTPVVRHMPAIYIYQYRRRMYERMCMTLEKKKKFVCLGRHCIKRRFRVRA